jgi:hypothetical protein
MLKAAPAENVTDVTAKPAAPDYLAGLDDLAGQADSQDAQATTDAQAAQHKRDKTEADTMAADLASALGMAASVAQPAMWWLTPEQFEQYWGEGVRAGIAASGAEIMRRHGLSMGDLFTQYGPYIALAGALGPSALATMAAYKRETAKAIETAKRGTSGSQ